MQEKGCRFELKVEKPEDLDRYCEHGVFLYCSIEYRVFGQRPPSPWPVRRHSRRLVLAPTHFLPARHSVHTPDHYLRAPGGGRAYINSLFCHCALYSHCIFCVHETFRVFFYNIFVYSEKVSASVP